MKHLKIAFLIAIVNLSYGVYAQRFTLNLSSGINFSDINNKSISGRWQSMPGSTNSISCDYSLGKIVSLKAEINYLNLYYNYKTYYYPIYWPIDFYYDLNYVPGYYNAQQDWSLSYLRFPLSITFRTPTRLSYYLSAGMYYSKLLKDNGNQYFEEIPGSDHGILFSNGISYTFDKKLRINFEIRYCNGKEKILAQDNGYNAALELNLGVGYVFPSKGNKTSPINNYTDSLNPSWLVKYSAGAIYSKIDNKEMSHYKPGMGISTGISLIYKTRTPITFEADILYQRKSYYMQDSSNSYYYYASEQTTTYVDSKTDIDFVNIPVMVNFSTGENARFYSGIGLYGAIRMNARVVGEAIKEMRYLGTYNEEKISIYDNIEGNIKIKDFGWLINTGFEIPFAKKFLIDINLRYQASFDNLNNNENLFDLNFKSLSLSAGVIIPII